MKEISVNVSSFERLRTQGDYMYVDKTAYVYSLVRSKLKNYYFISRPRRYGKSLMCSTLHALFDGKRELFRDLYIDKTDYSFEKYPVMHFNMALLSKVSYEAFLNDFQIAIMDEAESNGIMVERSEPSTMLNYVLKVAEKEVVIIIDEYDEPMIHTYEDKEKAERIRESFSQFYTVIKNRSEKIRFFFITGITKFSNMSIFSQMNNLTDLTFSDTCSAMFGYTEDELLSYFSDYIDEYMDRDDKEYKGREDFIDAIREYYDGYRFSYDSPIKVYNPVSIGVFFNNKCRFRPYWVETGASTLALALAKDYHLERIISENPVIGLNAINTFDYSLLAEKELKDSQVLALILFTGYLTIKEGDSNGIVLTFPNTEVRKTFTESFVELFSGIDVSIFAIEGAKATRARNSRRLVDVLNAFFKEFPYTILDKKERSYQEVFYAFFLMIGGIRIDAEEATLLGRSDIVLTSSHDVYIIEMKVDGSADEALSQINTREYYSRYINTDKEIHIIGMSFSSKSREIEEWREVIVDKSKEPSYLGEL